MTTVPPGPYDDLNAFMNRADELAESLLSEGITAMKIWPFDWAAEASGGNNISPANMNCPMGDKMTSRPSR